MNPGDPIFVAGHRGLAGSAIVRRLRQAGYSNLLLKTRQELDLRRQQDVESFFEAARPKYVFLAAAKVGGIQANKSMPGDFITDNLAIQTNVIQSAYRYKAEKLLFLGSACIYPKSAPQPMHETSLLTAPLEPANEAYAVAKIAGLTMCQAYQRQFGFPAITVVPANLYGPGDNFHLTNSHVLPALIRKFHDAKMSGQKQVEIWGSGKARREFLHADDLARACVFLMDDYNSIEPINVGWGTDFTIAEVASTVAAAVGYEGSLWFNVERPEGAMRMLIDASRVRALGWQPEISFASGLKSVYEWFQANYETARA